MLGCPILYCKGMRPMMFQLSGFYYRVSQVIRMSRLQGQWFLLGLGFSFLQGCIHELCMVPRKLVQITISRQVVNDYMPLSRSYVKLLNKSSDTARDSIIP